MKIFALNLLFFLAFHGCQSAAQSTIKPAELSSLLQKDDILLLDVRTPEEFQAGHIANALNINFYDQDFGRIVGELDNSKSIAVYCASGVRSAKAAAQLKTAGFPEVYTLEGGITAWQKKGFEVVR